ncbi:MAG: transglycosylase SLT domain-containing protein [Xanthobacteraceae bacterium]
MPIQATTLPTATGPVVSDAIRSAARTTGTSFSYLLATAKVESNLDPNQNSPTSSARGLFQFVDQTWMMMLKEAGSALGYGDYAQAIAGSQDGGYDVINPANREAVLALRDDPAASAALAGAFTRRNAQHLSAQLGRDPTEGELYIAHFLGAAGAGRLITLAATQPDTIAAQVFPAAASANRSVFYDRAGTARNALGVYNNLVGRYERASAATSAMAQAGGTATGAGTSGPQNVQALFAAPSDQRASTRAQSGPMFHSLFQNDPNRPGVSRFIADLWSTRPHVAAALSGGGLATERTTATRR